MTTTTTRTRTRTAVAASLALGVVGSALVLATPASAHSGGGGVRTGGTCSAVAHWTLKAKHDAGQIEVEGEVDTNRAGQHWTWRIVDNATIVRTGSSTTTPPSGSFTVSRRIGNRAGIDHLVFRAVRPATGQVCRGTLSV
jgi:hypothetical protein